MSFLSLSRPSARRVPAERVHGEYLKRQSGVLIATCFSYIGYYIIRLIFTTEQVPIRKAYGFSIAQIGLILSTFGIGYGIAKLVMGSIADRVNSKSFLAFGLYVSALLNAILAFSRDFWIILVLMLLISVTQASSMAFTSALGARSAKSSPVKSTLLISPLVEMVSLPTVFR